MKLRLKRLHPNAVIPTYARPGDACVDLWAVSMDTRWDYVEYGTGLAIEIPDGFVGVVRPRSSMSKRDLLFATSGIIDSGYRGELTVRFKKVKNANREHLGDPNWSLYNVGEAIAQLMIIPYPKLEFEEVEELSKTERGEGGHGSTDKNLNKSL